MFIPKSSTEKEGFYLDKTKEHILFITSGFPRTHNDSSARFILDLARALSRNGYPVFILAPYGEGSSREENWDGLKIFRFQYFLPNYWMRLAYGDGMLENIEKNMLLVFQVPFFVLMELLYEYRIVKKEKISIINAQRLIPQGIVTFLIKIVIPIRTIITVHGSDVRLPPRIFTKFFLKRADAIISPHPELTSILHSLGLPNVHEIPNIIDENNFNPEIPAETLRDELSISSKYVVTFIARLNDFKDPLTFVKSIPLILENESDVTFLIAGEGPLESQIRNHVEELEIDHYVRILGSRNDVNKILRISTIFTALSPFENIWSLVIVEAMKCKIPCIITNTGTTPNHLHDAHDAVLIPPRDEIALAREIVSLLHDDKKREEISDNALRLMESLFSVASIEEKYHRLISTISQI